MTPDRAFFVSNPEGPARPLSTGALFPASVDVQVFNVDDTDLVLTLRFKVVDDRPVLVAVTLSPLSAEGPVREIRSTDIHALPIEEIATRAVAVVSANFAAASPTPHLRDPGKDADGAVRAYRRRGISESRLRDVARIFTDPRNQPAPTRAVQQQLFCSYRTAGRWVAEARRRGLLDDRPSTESENT